MEVCVKGGQHYFQVHGLYRVGSSPLAHATSTTSTDSGGCRPALVLQLGQDETKATYGVGVVGFLVRMQKGLLLKRCSNRSVVLNNFSLMPHSCSPLASPPLLVFRLFPLELAVAVLSRVKMSLLIVVILKSELFFFALSTAVQVVLFVSAAAEEKVVAPTLAVEKGKILVHVLFVIVIDLVIVVNQAHVVIAIVAHVPL
jgi:hypothetical protein